jgi:hypothetical protein
MKKLIFILAFLPFITNAQMTPDSLLGCYVGTYKHYEQPDTTWTSIYPDTLIVFKVDSMLYQNNDTSFYIIHIGWVLKNATTRYDHYYTICTYEFGFRECPWSLDTMINYCYDEHKDEIIFLEDSIFYVGKYQYGQFANEETINFKGEKYTSEIPDSLHQVLIPKIKNNLHVNIYPNPVKEVLNIQFDRKDKNIITISDITGKQVYNKTYDKQYININFKLYKKGIYLINIKNTNSNITKKIIYL